MVNCHAGVASPKEASARGDLVEDDRLIERSRRGDLDAFDQLDRAYGDIPGDAVPEPPPSWANTSPPSSADLQTPFGLLYTTVMQASDKNRPGSAIDAMNHVAWALGLASSGN